MSMKNSSDTIRNQTHDLLACSTMPEPTASLHAPDQLSRWWFFFSVLCGRWFPWNHLQPRTLHYIIQGLDPLWIKKNTRCMYANERLTTVIQHTEHTRMLTMHALLCCFIYPTTSVAVETDKLHWIPLLYFYHILLCFKYTGVEIWAKSSCCVCLIKFFYSYRNNTTP